MKTPPSHEINCTRARGGTNPFWHGRHEKHPGIVGAGNSADNAIADFQKQFRSMAKRMGQKATPLQGQGP